MPTAININSRTLNLVDETNVSVKLRVGGQVVTYTAAEIIANANSEQTNIQAVVGLGVDTTESIKTDYVYSSGIVQDTEGNDYPSTYLSGKEIDYAATLMNTNFFNDVT